jgi:uncharacterized protein (DUF58 family)
VRITARGIGLLVAGVLLLGAGFRFGYPELAALGCAAVVAVAGAVAFVAWRPRLRVDRVADPDRVMRGEPSRLTLTIGNVSRLFGASLVARDRIRPAGPGQHGSRERRGIERRGIERRGIERRGTERRTATVPVPLVRLRPGRETRVTYQIPTSRRGVVEVGPLQIGRRDPLALVRAVRGYGDSVRVWVRPRVHPIAAVPVGLSRSMDGRVDRVPHGSITFAALREYVVGDDLRRVHWRTSARVGELMVRENVDTSLPRVVILLDDRASAHAPGPDGESTFEAACEAAASVVVAAMREDVWVELQLVGGLAEHEERAGDSRGREPETGTVATGTRGQVGPLLDLLAEATLTSPAPAVLVGARAAGDRSALQAAVERLRVRRMGDTLLYLAGPRNEDALGIVAGLRGAYPSIIAGVFGAIEGGLTTSVGLLVLGAVDGADFAAAWDGVRAW